MVNLQPIKPTRRQMIMTSVAAGTLLIAPSADAQVGLANFMEISRQLVGSAVLDRDLGATYFRALSSDPTSHRALQRLIEQGDDGSQDVERIKQAILRQWYLGVYEENGQASVATFERALIWNSLGFDQPVGTCRGPVGFWSEPPGG